MNKVLRGVFGRAKPAVNIQRDYYTMATVNGDEAEIVMYGEIVQERPRNWWTDEPIEGNYIVLNEFLEDLEKVAHVKRLTIRLNSIGGDAYAAIPIHNRLRELKAEVTAIVDGVAMSGGSLIMCAADTVKVNPSSLIMIHKCYVRIWGAYTAEELRSIADGNDAVDKAQVAIYKRKTGIGEDELLAMMEDETYMTGQEALDKGFADELLDEEAPDIAASADLTTLYVNGRAFHVSTPLSNLPESIPTVQTDTKSVKTNNNPVSTGDSKGGKTMAKTLEELRAENPELADQIMAQAKEVVTKDAVDVSAAVEAERRRIAEIDEIAALYDEELVREAKFGENPLTAQELAWEAAKRQAKKGQEFIKDVKEDFETSGASEVVASATVEDDSKPLTPAERMAQGRQQAKNLQTKEDK